MAYDLVIKGARIVTHARDGIGDIGFSDGRVARLGDIASHEAGTVIDARGLVALPGVIDTQVHFREPGLEHKEDLESGSRAAVMGGVVAVFEMPNTTPPTSVESAITDKLDRARGRMHCDFAFYVGADGSNTADLPDLERLSGVCGVKVFMGASTGSLLVSEDSQIAAILAVIKRRAAFHSEDEMILQAQRDRIVVGAPSSHLLWRDSHSALSSTERLLRLARFAGKQVHVLHVTTLDEMQLLFSHRDIASVEVTPQHLTLAAPDCYDRLGTHAQMNPPIRGIKDRDGLWAGLRAGVIDVIGSDHAPHSLDEKAQVYPQSPSGMPGVQTLLPLMLDHVARGRLSLTDLVRLTSYNAHRLFGLTRKGVLAEGMDGDVTLVDPAVHRTIDNTWLASKCGWSPFCGMEVTGWPVMTIIRGHSVMRDGELTAAGQGDTIQFDL